MDPRTENLFWLQHRRLEHLAMGDHRTEDDLVAVNCLVGFLRVSRDGQREHRGARKQAVGQLRFELLLHVFLPWICREFRLAILVGAC